MKFLPARYVTAILTALGNAIIYGLRVNISITMVSMVNHTGTSSTSERGVCGNLTKDDSGGSDGDYNWSNNLQGYILSSYYWGYIVVMFPGARMCELTSVKWMWFFAVSINIVGCLLIPLGSDIHYGCAILLRVLQGFGGGISFPATSLLLAAWAPTSEKNTFASILFSGTVLGTVTGIIITGLINIYVGWKAVFYIMGASSAPWLILWYFLIADTPEKAKFITPEEVEYILSSQGEKVGQKKKIKIQWKNIFKSKPFWALLVAHTCSNWNFYLLLTDLPIYLDKVFAMEMKFITIYTSVGYFGNWAFSIAVGRTLDHLRKKGKINQTWAKKIATLLASVPIAFCMVGLNYIGCNQVVGIILVILCLTFFGGMWCGFMSNHVDIGPKIAATLMGMTNTPGTLSGIVVPIFVGKILGDGTDLGAWEIIFWVAVGFFAVEIIVYTIWGSGEAQNYYLEEEVT